MMFVYLSFAIKIYALRPTNINSLETISTALLNLMKARMEMCIQ